MIYYKYKSVNGGLKTTNLRCFSCYDTISFMIAEKKITKPATNKSKQAGKKPKPALTSALSRDRQGRSMVSKALAKEMLKAGIHFGHKKSNWNPKMIFSRIGGFYG